MQLRRAAALAFATAVALALLAAAPAPARAEVVTKRAVSYAHFRVDPGGGGRRPPWRLGPDRPRRVPRVGPDTLLAESQHRHSVAQPAPGPQPTMPHPCQGVPPTGSIRRGSAAGR